MVADPRERPGDLQEDLVGRESEVASLTEFLAAAAASGAARVVVGEPGVGKTEMLHTAAVRAAASGMRVVTASGLEFEATISYSGLHQILYSFLDDLDVLPPVHKNALSVALGLDDGDAPRPLVTFNAAFALLAHAAQTRPLILLVEDAHWLDPASAAALGFIGRRVDGHRIGLLVSRRTASAGAFAGSGLPEVRLEPLTRAHSERLLDARRPDLPPWFRRRVLDQAGGNPLAILELANSAERLGESKLGDLPDVLPLTGRMEASFAFRIADLPSATQRALLLLALDARADLRPLLQTEISLEQLAPAERAGLISVDLARSSARFRHPLVRSAVVAHSSSDDRRTAHLAIAASLSDDFERMVWHRAEAAVEPDEEIARLLEQVARIWLGRGDARTATATLRRAALLSPGRPDRNRRLAEAAYLGAVVIGESDDAYELLNGVEPQEGGQGSILAAVAAAYLFVNAGGDYGTAHHAILRAVEAGGHGWRADDEELVQAMFTWMVILWLSGREEYWARYFETLHRLQPAVPDALWVASQAFPDTVRTGAAVRGRLVALLQAQDTGRDPNVVIRLNTAAVYLDLLPLARTTGWRMVEDGRRGGAMRSYLRALVHMCLDLFSSGHWQTARELADEGEAAARTGGYESELWYFLYMQSLLAAVRGETDLALTAASELERIEAQRDAQGALRFAHHTRTLAAQAVGDWEAAYRHACALSPAGTFAPYTPHAMWVAFDLVDSALRTGRVDEARRHADEMERVDLPAISPRLALLTAGARALVAESGWYEAFQTAVGLPGAADWPFDRARILLAFGERLRRAQRPRDAREMLHPALETFERLGATPWADRARAELRAARARIPSGAGGAAALTAQERAVAELAAKGLSNKEIAGRLYLAPRTVSGHLYRAFPKLGVTSRASLRDALTPEPSDDEV